MNELAFRSSELQRFAQIFKALGDETRQKILLLLHDQPMNVNRIVEHFTLAQPTISRHLAVLRQAQLVTGKRSRQQIIYRLAPETLQHLCDTFFAAFCTKEPGKKPS
jgi:DNA-binding transcriptional ArsR family regulator